MNSRWPILVVDDEAARESLATWLSRDGYEVDTASSGEQALEKSQQREYAIYFVDLEMAEAGDGVETLTRIRRQWPEAVVVIVTAQSTVDRAITALQQGAWAYLVKPCSPQEPGLLVNRIVRMKSLEHENSLLRKKLTGQYMVGDIITRNPRMCDLLAQCRELAVLDTPILIRGDRGAGKKMVARAIHHAGHRASKPMRQVCCTGLTAAELFGCEKGACSGASRQKLGQLEMADGGTILLGEVGGLSPHLQLEVLRFLRAGLFYRVGGLQEVRVDVRVIAATRADLPQAVAGGEFDGELCNRLNALAIDIPPLRERREDIPLLAGHFLEQSAKDKREISEGAWKLLMAYNWPGNVGELENAVACALAISPSQVLGEDAFSFLVLHELAARTRPAPPMTLEAMEKVLIVETLRRTIGNVKESASQLGIDRSTLYEKIKRYEIPR